MPLKPDDLATAMVDALPAAWTRVKGVPFPGGNTDDAKVMLLAVARGLLTYLENNQNTMIASLRLQESGISRDYSVEALDLSTDLT
jgi:hypothetical protein